MGLNIQPTGYPANPKAGYRISGGRILDIRPDFLKNIFKKFCHPQ
jgi:hypothetical protein